MQSKFAHGTGWLSPSPSRPVGATAPHPREGNQFPLPRGSVRAVPKLVLDTIVLTSFQRHCGLVDCDILLSTLKG